MNELCARVVCERVACAKVVCEKAGLPSDAVQSRAGSGNHKDAN